MQLADSGLEGADFRGAVLRGCTISRCKLDNGDFRGADLGDTAFIRCKMENCKFEGAMQEHAAFDRCARFGSTGIGGDTRAHCEVVFDGMMGMIRGVDLDHAKGWRQFTCEHTGPGGDAYGNLLWELQEKFHEIDTAYPGMGAEIFNSGLRFLPHELRGAASFIAYGNTVETAHQLAAQGAFTGEEPLPEQAMYVLPHSEVQKNFATEQAFTARMQRIEGLNFLFSSAWIQTARDIAEDQAGALGIPLDERFRQALREYGDAFEQADRQHGGAIVKEIFERNQDFLPHELLPAAALVHSGGTLGQAYSLALEDKLAPEPSPAALAYEYIGCATEQIAGLAGEGGTRHSFDEIQAAYHLNSGQMPLLTELLRERVELESDGPAGTFTMWPKPEPAQREALSQADLEIIHALHTLWAHGQPGGERAGFSGQELSGLDFTGMRFTRVSFAGAALDTCWLNNADFSQCDFSGAALRDISASAGMFGGANFSCAALDTCDFTSEDMDGADFSQAELRACAGLEGHACGQTMAMQ
jgi:uncharacterized protein YjbI with pentapeptide repeats